MALVPLLHVLCLTSLASSAFIPFHRQPASVRILESRSVEEGISLVIETDDKNLRLDLSLADDIWSEWARIVTVEESEDGATIIKKNSIDAKPKIYVDPKVGAVLRIQDGEVDGILDHEWSIKNTNGEHYAYKRSPVGSLERDYLEVPDDILYNDSYTDFGYFGDHEDLKWRYAKQLDEMEFNPREIDSYNVEVTVVVDSALAKQIGSDEEVTKYLTIFWNGVNRRYFILDDPLITIKLVGVVILRQLKDEPFVQNNKLNDDKIVSSDTLRSFSRWVYTQRKTLPPHDIAFLQTGMNMAKKNGDAQLTGLAYRGASCKRKGGVSYGSSMGEDIGGFYHGVNVAAHEIAHNLGAPHDGQESMGTGDCPWSDGYIMSYETGSINQLFFSKCTKNAIRSYLSSLPAICLKINLDEIGLTNELPGDNLSMDEQCKHLTGMESAHVDTSVEPQDSLCYNLVCKYNESSHTFVLTTHVTAADNTPCPQGGKCTAGKCIQI